MLDQTQSTLKFLTNLETFISSGVDQIVNELLSFGESATIPTFICEPNVSITTSYDGTVNARVTNVQVFFPRLNQAPLHEAFTQRVVCIIILACYELFSIFKVTCVVYWTSLTISRAF